MTQIFDLLEEALSMGEDYQLLCGWLHEEIFEKYDNS